MRGRPFVVAWREDDTAEALKAAYLAERDGMIRSRLQALWLLRVGRSLGEVTAAMGIHYRSVQRWVAWYRNGGLAPVRTRRSGGVGQPAFLSVAAQEELAREVATGRFRTARQIQTWMRTQYQVSYTLGGVYSLLERVKCAPKVPRRLHAQADEATQLAWKKGTSSKRLPSSS